MITAILITAIVREALGALATVSLVGKPRRPIAPSAAVTTVVASGAMIAWFAYVLVSSR